MRRLLGWALAAIVLVVVAFLGMALVGSTLPPVDDLARTAPRRTSWMRARVAQARAQGRILKIDHRWVPYERISPRLRRAVLIAEDDAFFAHGGLDWDQIEAAARANLRRGRVVRGGSTITQQLAKNLYLGEERSVLRKLKEVLLAKRIERALSKRRIFELYLNLIEWGDGVFGVEAAARRYFGAAAADLDALQAARLAAVIINPRRYSPVDPSPRIEKRTRMILGRMRRRGLIGEVEYRAALGEVPPPGPMDWLFGGAPDTTSAPGVLPVPAPGDSSALGDSSDPGDSTGGDAFRAPR